MTMSDIRNGQSRGRVVSTQNMLNRLARNPSAETLMRDLKAAEKIKPATVRCKTPEEAVHLGALMCERGISHDMELCGISKKCGRWLADIFWDYVGEYMERDEFFSRYAFRLSDMPYTAEQLWTAVSGKENAERANMLSIIKTVRAAQDLPAEFLEAPNAVICDETADTTPDLVWGRHKNRVELARLSYLRANRNIGTVEIGMDGDADVRGFLGGSFENSIEKQIYISSEIKPLDKLYAELDENGFTLFHGGEAVGRLSEGFRAELGGYDGRIENIYVSAVTAEPLFFEEEKMPRLCFGLKITGLARLARTVQK